MMFNRVVQIGWLIIAAVALFIAWQWSQVGRWRFVALDRGQGYAISDSVTGRTKLSFGTKVVWIDLDDAY